VKPELMNSEKRRMAGLTAEHAEHAEMGTEEWRRTEDGAQRPDRLTTKRTKNAKSERRREEALT
jgi:hypothetical protein